MTNIYMKKIIINNNNILTVLIAFLSLFFEIKSILKELSLSALLLASGSIRKLLLLLESI